MTGNELPAIIADLVVWLVDQGFREEERTYDPAAFGNWLITLASASCRIRLVRDRSQWLVDVSGDGLSGWYDTDLWQACLEDGKVTTSITTVDAKIAFVRESIPAIIAALHSPADLDRCLRLRRDERADRMFGSWWRGRA